MAISRNRFEPRNSKQETTDHVRHPSFTSDNELQETVRAQNPEWIASWRATFRRVVTIILGILRPHTSHSIPNGLLFRTVLILHCFQFLEECLLKGVERSLGKKNEIVYRNIKAVLREGPLQFGIAKTNSELSGLVKYEWHRTPPEEAHEDLPCTSSVMEHPITLPGITPATVLSDTTGNHPDAASASATATCKPPPIHIAEQYRHTKGYCNRPARCVRCGRDHDSATCEKSRDTPATCALCGGDHPANYKGCTVYKDLQKISKPVGNKRDIPPPTSEPATTDGGRSSSYPPAPPAVSRPPPRAVVAVPPARSRPTDTTTARVIVPIVNNPDNKNKKFSQIKPHIHPAPPSFAQVVSKRKNRPATTTPNSTPQRAQPKTPQTLPPTGPSSTPVAHSSTTTPVFSIQIVTALASFTNEFRTLASDLIAALTSLSSLLTTLTSRFLSGGDYNCKHPTWGSRVATPRGRMLYRVINQNGYDTISPDNPTYWPTHPNRLPDVLDFFITSGLRGIHSLSQVLNDLSSDHSPVLLTTSLDPILELPPPILTPGYTDWNYFAQSLDSVIDLRVPLKTPEDLDEAVQEFTLAVQRTARTSSQPPTPKYNTQSINLPQHIRLLITHKRRARSKWQRTRYPSDRQHYEQLAHELRSELSSFRSDTYNSYIISLSTHDRSLWDSTKRLPRSHPTPSPLRHPDNSWARSDEDKAQLFANHLRSIFQPSPESDPIHSHQVQEYLDSPLPLTLPPSPFSPSEVTYAIQHLPRKKSPGYDLITGEILRHLPRRAILFLTYLYNAILRTTYFPLLWKFAHIKMIPKPNKLHTEPFAYRPISLLPIFSKLFEKLFLKRLVPIFESQNIIPSHQFGFRPFHSTIHQCLHIVDIISSSLEQKQYCGAAFLDVEQAFDRVWHPGLLYKLKKILPSTYYLILQSYLKDRYSDIQSQKGGKLHLPSSVVSCVLFLWNMFRRLDAIFCLRASSKRRNMFHKNKTQETTEEDICRAVDWEGHDFDGEFRCTRIVTSLAEHRVCFHVTSPSRFHVT
ncbi:hypothetical protein AAG570_013887 [Ranatra chinensis]|uniref:Reverse transcriptase domain-containing protein n=1 Tax=Ranatra chinensis TaxID=642074 RepID=A0ABD0YDG3_9HEMI